MSNEEQTGDSQQGPGAETVAAPTQQSERFLALDATRGFALFGIVLVNVLMGAQPINVVAMPWPMSWLGPEDIQSWAAISVFMMGAARCMFGLMFGAGMVLIMDRLTDRLGRKGARKIYFRRLWILLLVGLIDMLLFMWWGDILFLYALCGMVIYLFRNAKTWVLVMGAAVFLSIATLIMVGMTTMMNGMADQYPSVEAAIEAGEALTPEQEMVKANMAPVMDEAVFNKEIQVLSEGSLSEVYHEILTKKVPMNLMGGLIFASWDSLFAMLIGVLMYRAGLLTGQASVRTYAIMAVVGLGVGFAVRYWVVAGMMASGYNDEWLLINAAIMQPGRLLVAVGFVGLIQLMVRVSIFDIFSNGFAAMGQMALSGYLGQSVIYLALLYGFSGGLYGQLQGFELWGLALAIFAAQVIVSVIWLRHYRFGPFEWLWRSWTYKKKMPMRKRAD